METNSLVEEGWIRCLKKLGALWIHDGNPNRPHVLLTSGKHSNGYFDASKVIEQPKLLHEICLTLLGQFSSVFDRVVGSAFGAITMAHEIGAIRDTKCGFTEPVVISGRKGVVFRRFNIVEGERVLVVEDVITTGGTTRKTITALKEKGADILPLILALVNRSEEDSLDGRKIIALVNYSLPTWGSKKKCPLCDQGSEAIRPKENWDKLTADY